MTKKRVTEEMFLTMKIELIDYKPLIRKICENQKINPEKYVDDLPDSDGYSYISLFVLFNYCDAIDRIFEYSSYKTTCPFYTRILKTISYEAEFKNKMDYLEMVNYDILQLKCSYFSHPYDEKVIDEIYELSKNVAESDAECNLVKIANLITDIECTGVDMLALGRCTWIRDKVYLMKASQDVYFRIKKKMDVFPEINDFKYVEFDDEGLLVIDADTIQDFYPDFEDIWRKLWEDEEK